MFELYAEGEFHTELQGRYPTLSQCISRFRILHSRLDRWPEGRDPVVRTPAGKLVFSQKTDGVWMDPTFH